MNIKDLAVTTELSHEERAAVRGGSLDATQFGSALLISGGDGSINIGVQANPQIAVLNEINVDTTNLINAFGSQTAGIVRYTA